MVKRDIPSRRSLGIFLLEDKEGVMAACAWCGQRFRNSVKVGRKKLLCERCWAKAGESTRKEYARVDANDFDWDSHDWGWEEPEEDK